MSKLQDPLLKIALLEQELKEERETHKDSEAKAQRLEYLLNLADLAYQDYDKNTLIEVFCKRTLHLLNWNFCRFLLLSDHNQAQVSFSSNQQQQLPIFERIIQDITLSEHYFIYSNRQNTDFKKHGIIQCYAEPIVLNGSIYGIAEFYLKVETPVDTDVFEVIASGARQVSSVIEKRESQIELQKNYIEIKNAQSALIQSEKLASIGTIAAGVAHEINNPLSFLLSNLETLALYHEKEQTLFNLYNTLESCCSPPSAKTVSTLDKIKKTKKLIDLEYILNDQKQLVQESLEGISRISEIVKSLKTFARNHEGDDQEIDINECIEAALKVASNELKYKCEVIKNLNKLPKIKMNPSHLLQVIMNILINAAHALEKRGRIYIKSSLDEQFICVAITDDGIGMSEELQKKLFTPFFTTKPVGKGTGLGLSVSYGIIKKMGGEILVKSKPGEGSTFTIKIPTETGAKHENK